MMLKFDCIFGLWHKDQAHRHTDIIFLRRSITIEDATKLFAPYWISIIFIMYVLTLDLHVWLLSENMFQSSRSRCRNWMCSSLHHAQHAHQGSWKLVQNLLSNSANKQTNQGTWKHKLLGRGDESEQSWDSEQGDQMPVWSDCFLITMCSENICNLH